MDAPSSPTPITVWYARVASLDNPAVAQLCMAMLDATERAAYARFRVEHAKNAYLLAHALCRAALSRHGAAAAILPSAWRFVPAAGGKPTLAGPPSHPGLHFNLTHCRSAVAVALCAEHPVGIDIEDAARAIRWARLAPRVLTPEEHADCARHPEPSRRFLQHWTLKEAYLKAQGSGISENLSRINMRIDSASPEAPATVEDTRPHAPESPWHLRLLPVDPAFVLAVAAPVSVAASRFVCSDGASLLNL